MNEIEQPKPSYEHPVSIKLEQAESFLKDHLGQGVSGVEPIGKGLWSQAFYFDRGGADYVVRFGNEAEPYEKDRLATKYSSEKLPIPNITETGTVAGHYFAISERRTGAMIDDMSGEEIAALTPALLDMLNALRIANVSASTGYGHWNAVEAGQYATWRDFLLAVGDDEHESKIHGWRTSLEASPQGANFFDSMAEELRALSVSTYEGRHLVHTDLLHFNVLAKDKKITAVIDWGNAMYGDFLYDLANFTFWSPLHSAIQKIDWRAGAKEYFGVVGAEIGNFDDRLRACELHVGLAGMAWNAHTKNWQELEATTRRIAELFA